MSAAKKKQISETLKRRWAERKAERKAPLAFDGVETYRKIVPADNGREKLAVDVIDMVTPHLKSLSTETLVALVERILRP